MKMWPFQLWKFRKHGSERNTKSPINIKFDIVGASIRQRIHIKFLYKYIRTIFLVSVSR
jgi:hypothetical protein